MAHRAPLRALSVAGLIVLALSLTAILPANAGPPAPSPAAGAAGSPCSPQCSLFLPSALHFDGLAFGQEQLYEVDTASAYPLTIAGTDVSLLLPAGGHGSLRITPVVSSQTAPPASGLGYRVSFSGPEQVQLRVPAGADRYVFGFKRTSPPAIDGTPAAWLPVPEAGRANNGDVLYNLYVPATATESVSAAAGCTMARWWNFGASPTVWIANLSTEQSARLAQYRTRVVANLSTWLAALPDAARTEAQARINGDYSLYVYPTTGGSFYTGFAGGSLCPTMAFGVDAAFNASSAGHEVGHYMNHVLAGPAYQAIEALAPDVHGLGDIIAGGPAVEEYAYFSDHLLNGNIGSTNSGSLPFRWLAQTSGKLPATADFSQMEGSGAAQMIAVLNTSTSVTDHTGNAASVPLVAGVTAGEMAAALFASGATTLTAFDTELRNLLTAEAQLDKLAVLQERLGWSYHATGSLAGGTCSGAQATIQNFVKAGLTNTEYNMAAVQADAQGAFTLPRVLPGTSKLRVTIGASTPVEVASPTYAQGATSTALDLGEISVPGLTPALPPDKQPNPTTCWGGVWTSGADRMELYQNGSDIIGIFSLGFVGGGATKHLGTITATVDETDLNGTWTESCSGSDAGTLSAWVEQPIIGCGGGLTASKIELTIIDSSQQLVKTDFYKTGLAASASPLTALRLADWRPDQ